MKLKFNLEALSRESAKEIMMREYYKTTEKILLCVMCMVCLSHACFLTLQVHSNAITLNYIIVCELYIHSIISKQFA